MPKLPKFAPEDVGKIKPVDNLVANNIKAKRVLVGKNNGKIAVVGRGMDKRVNVFAEGIGAETFKPSKKALGLYDKGDKSLLMKENKKWIKRIKRKGYTVYDVGLDPKFTAKSDFSKGDFYEMETKELFGD